MVKKIVVITLWSGVVKKHYEQLKNLFGDAVEIKYYSFDVDNINQDIDADLVLISLYSIYIAVKKYISNKSQIVIINPTITAKQYDQIMTIPAGEKVMLVNYSSEMTMETIALFNQLGINHVEFTPFYPGIKNVPELKIALTPGEPQHVPDFVEKVIDIGHRVLGTSTIVDIAVKLNLDYLLQEDRFIEHLKSLKTHSSGLEALLGKTNTLESEFDSLLNILDDGIIAVDANGLIHGFNKRAEKIIGLKKGEVIGKNVKTIVSQIPFDSVIGTSKSIKAMLVKIKGKNISTTIVPVITLKKVTGALAIINEFTEEEKYHHKLRGQLLGKGHKAKYKFEDIIGQSPAIEELKGIAKRMAKSDSSVLICGESGTGKELFAQAIHNTSKRKNYQFVAVNCAALPESLLESELFGYEEGAFTGARKGGKIGLFELAHNGTLFLDEIGEMALNLQARLLRVIQEREVMRIGGDSVINIDIRIIAATNKNLKELVDKGEFRRDLYYRLNVLPLNTIPLRERREDIMLLVDNIQKEVEAEFELSEESIEAFKNYSWEGNVRELNNYIEYLAHLGKRRIEIQDIPFVKERAKIEVDFNSIDSDKITRFLEYIEGYEKEYTFILSSLENSLRNRVRIGRRSIAKLAKEKDIYISENDIRKRLEVLRNHKMVRLSNGRGGTQITDLGVETLKYIENRV
ncbi:sigma 54-interacting transcriptional regulator [Wukongibacter baidiensis]|uniref:sigma-54 interaction domain-containing protein n=1 Tax=Wukongibacter baidiensis TaxID=1723361 RepID=UPI003D7F4013